MEERNAYPHKGHAWCKLLHSNFEQTLNLSLYHGFIQTHDVVVGSAFMLPSKNILLIFVLLTYSTHGYFGRCLFHDLAKCSSLERPGSLAKRSKAQVFCMAITNISEGDVGNSRNHLNACMEKMHISSMSLNNCSSSGVIFGVLYHSMLC